MKFIIPVALVIVILLMGLVKTKRTLEINGKVIDEFTKSPVPRREVIVQGLVLKNKMLVSIEAGNFSTDSSGSFIYALRKIKDAHTYHFCLVGDSDYSYSAENLALSYLERNAKHLSFSLKKLADLTMLVFRKSKTPVCDTLFLSWRSDGVDGRTLYPFKINNNGLTSNSELRWIGGNVKAAINTRAFADQRTIVKWTLFRNGKKKEIIDTITCKRDMVNKIYLRY